MRVRVLPRATAAAVITGSVSALGRAVGALVLVLTIPVLVETMVRRGRADELLVPLLCVLVMLAGIAVLAWRPRTPIALGQIALGAVATYAYQVALLQGDPALLDDALYLVNRPTLAIAAIGVTATTAVAGVAWSVVQTLVAAAVMLAACVTSGVPYRTGYGMWLVLVVAVAAYLTLAAIQRAQRRRVPNIEQLELENARLACGEDLARRTTAIVHDTLLNDLAIVMNTEGPLAERARDRLRKDLETLRGADWLRQTEGVALEEPEQRELRTELVRMMNELQWRGLTIRVTGYRGDVVRLPPGVGEALRGAARAALENVLRHSGTTVADLEVIYGPEAITLMVADHGAGFSPDRIAADRLGIRGSIVERMERVGGEARIWSTPGEGTSVLLTVPVEGGAAPDAGPSRSDRTGGVA